MNQLDIYRLRASLPISVAYSDWHDAWVILSPGMRVCMAPTAAGAHYGYKELCAYLYPQPALGQHLDELV